MISPKTINKVIKELIKKFPQEKIRIKIGVNQVAKLWRKEDGSEKEFIDFCLNNFETVEKAELIFQRYNEKYEHIKGHLIALYLKLRLELDEDRGELLNIDRAFSNLNPLTHLSDDLFKTKIAFIILLNFKADDLKTTIANMDKLSRKEWAINRMTKQFTSRVPSEVSQKITNTYSKASEYVYSYNIKIKNITDENGKKIFDEELTLITHWGLRDQIKLYYREKDEIVFKKQKAIYNLMTRIITGEYGWEFANGKEETYNPFTNEINGKKNSKVYLTRYEHLKNIYLAHKEEDKYHLLYKDYITRIFEGVREIPFKKIEDMFLNILKEEVTYNIAEYIKTKLNRNLDPFDIWFNQFSQTSDDTNLDEKVKEKYPTLESFQNSIKDILIKLDFDEKTANYLAEKIEVDPARGAGHAWGPEMRGEKAHLRTRVVDGKYFNWQAFNTAMHELGHCVEQIFTLYDVDYNLLNGVPNTAFTEAMAFVFQNKSYEILGIKKDKNEYYTNSIQKFWDTREIAGVALVDMYIWKWMYKKKRFTTKELRDKIIEIAKELWNKYYYPVFGVKDSPILAIYSHMIFHGLYLPDYPLGHIISHQIEKYFEKTSIGKDMKRICELGSINPVKWMKEAVGSEISEQVLIEDAKNAINYLKEKV
ncbi:MAG: hypothetical protein K6357_03480 [Elusimicrobiota bacterium]